MSEANSDRNADAKSGVKYLIYGNLLPKIEQIAKLGYKETGGMGWAVNFVINQFSDDAISLLSRTATQVAHFKFWMNGFQWEIKVTAPKDSPEAQMGIQIDPRAIFSPQALSDASAVQPMSSPVISVGGGSCPPSSVSDPFSSAMSDLLG